MEGQVIGRTQHGDVVYGTDEGPQGGDDHPRRGGAIAGDALSGLLDRVVYLEAIVSERERNIADLDEEVGRLKGVHSDSAESFRRQLDRANRESRRVRKVMDGLDDAAKGAHVILQSVFDRAQGRPVGKASKPIQAIPAKVHVLRFETRQADLLRRGGNLQYDKFPDNDAGMGGGESFVFGEGAGSPTHVGR